MADLDLWFLCCLNLFSQFSRLILTNIIKHWCMALRRDWNDVRLKQRQMFDLWTAELEQTVISCSIMQEISGEKTHFPVLVWFSDWIIDEDGLQEELYHTLFGSLGFRLMFSRDKSHHLSPRRSPTGLRLYLSHGHSRPSQLQLLLTLPEAQRDGSGGGGRGGRGLRPAPSPTAAAFPHRVYAEGQPAPLPHLLQYQRLQAHVDHPSVFTQWTLPVLRTLQPDHRNTHSIQK